MLPKSFSPAERNVTEEGLVRAIRANVDAFYRDRPHPVFKEINRRLWDTAVYYGLDIRVAMTFGRDMKEVRRHIAAEAGTTGRKP